MEVRLKQESPFNNEKMRQALSGEVWALGEYQAMTDEDRKRVWRYHRAVHRRYGWPGPPALRLPLSYQDWIWFARRCQERYAVTVKRGVEVVPGEWCKRVGRMGSSIYFLLEDTSN